MKTHVFLLMFSVAMAFLPCSSNANVTNITSGGALFPDFNSAIAAANNGDVLRGLNAAWLEQATVPVNLQVTIDGGYDATFTTKTGNSFVSSSSGQPVFFINPGAHVLFNSLMISGGDGTGIMGGGITALSSTGVVVNCVIIDCHAQFGAGLYSAGLIVISNTLVNGNSAHQDGGGVFVHSDSAFYAHDHSTIDYNISGESGGGLYAQSNTVVHIVDSIVAKNVATNSGGGVYTQHSEVIIQESKITGNTSLNAGGGLYSQQDTLHVYDSWIGTQSSPNKASVMAAGLYAHATDLHLQNVIVEGNTGGAFGFVGGIYASASDPVWFSNVVVRYNTSYNLPGIFVDANGGLVAHHLQLVSNSSPFVANRILAQSNLFIDTLDVAYNKVDQLDVGGLFLGLQQGHGVILRPTVTHNLSSNGVGGLEVYVGASSQLLIDDAYITDNKGYGAWGVGGLHADGEENSLLRLRAVSQPVHISHNKGGLVGGVRVVEGTVELHAPTAAYPIVIADNSSDGVGGLLLDESFFNPHSSLWYGAVHVLSNRGAYGGVAMTNTVFGQPSVLHAIPTNNLYAQIAFNTALDSGGGVRVAGQGNFARLHGAHIANNTAVNAGGGVSVVGGGDFGAINTWVYDNISSNYGGGVAAFDAGTLVRFDADFTAAPSTHLPLSRIVNNRAINEAGGVSVSMSGGLFLYNTLVASNVVESGPGGGVVVDASYVDVQNAVVVHNQAASGGGIRLVGALQSDIVNSTIAHNHNQGIYANNTPLSTIINTIVWGHGGNEFNEINVTSLLTHCIVQGGYPGTVVLTGDPLFVNPSALDYQISLTSPAIDAGVVTAVTTDCIGITRPHFMAYDIGAYEFVPEPASILIFALAGLWALRRRG